MAEHYQQYVATKSQIEQARILARSGHKDEARRMLHFIEQARIVDILNRIEFPKDLPVDCALLRWNLSQLETEIHPSTIPNPATDIQTILARLDVIAHFVQKTKGAVA